MAASSYSGFITVQQHVHWSVAIIAATLALAFFIGLLLLVRKLGSQDKLLVYRRVVSRKPAADGSNGNDVVLECGHNIRIIHQEREMFPCDACKEAAKISKAK